MREYAARDARGGRRSLVGAVGGRPQVVFSIARDLQAHCSHVQRGLLRRLSRRGVRAHAAYSAPRWHSRCPGLPVSFLRGELSVIALQGGAMRISLATYLTSATARARTSVVESIGWIARARLLGEPKGRDPVARPDRLPLAIAIQRVCNAVPSPETRPDQEVHGRFARIAL